MDFVARNGHLDVVRYLHDNRTEGCTAMAMNFASQNGHLGVVEFLHGSRTEGCIDAALLMAARFGHLPVVKFLLEHRSEGDLMVPLTKVATHNKLELFKLLHSSLLAGESAYAVLEADVLVDNRRIIEHLCANQDREPVSFLKQAVAKGSIAVVGKIVEVVPSIPIEELLDAIAFAFEQNRSEIADSIDYMTRLRAWRRVAE